MAQVALAEKELSKRVEADLVAVEWEGAAADPLPSGLERLECELVGDSVPQRRLMSLLAYRRADRAIDAGRAARLALKAIDRAHLLENGPSSPWLFAAGLALGAAGRTAEAAELFGKIRQWAWLMETYAAFSAASAQRGVERYRQGALEGAIRDLQAALDAARGQPWETMVDDGRATLIRAYSDSGQAELAEQQLRAWCATGPLPETTFGTRLLIERGRLRLAQGRVGDALADLQSVQTRLDSRADSMIFEWRGAAAITHHKLGQHLEALQLAKADLRAAEAWGAPRQLASAHRTLAQICGGEDGIRHGYEALTIVKSSSARLEHARTLVGLGALFRRGGQPGRARTLLQAGIELARECGARALVDRAQEEIDVSGAVRRRGQFLSGPAALTASEHRVARLAASGMSNPEIARMLVVTRKTVEMHLGNAYRKLDINSRADLGSALLAGEAV
jgi:DNA-binding CsgD family transcriptional regulator